MSKNFYVGVSGKAREGQELYVGIGGRARKVVAGYVGVNGKARKFWPGVFSWNQYKVNYVESMTDEIDGTRTFNFQSDVWADDSIKWNEDEQTYQLRNPSLIMSLSQMQSGYRRYVQGGNYFLFGYSSVSVHTSYWYAVGRVYFNGNENEESFTMEGHAQYFERIGTQGEFIGIVESEDENAYPSNGIQDGYWYVAM